MKNRLFALFLILLVLVSATSCQQADETDNLHRTVTLSLRNVQDPNSRTIRPDAYTQPESYTVTLDAAEGNGTDKTVSDIPATGTSITLTDVAIGSYTVSVMGYKDSVLVMEGQSTSNLIVAPNGAKTATISLEVIYDEGSGTVEVPLDWSTVTDDRIADGFVLKMADNETGYVLGTYTYKAKEGSKTSDTASFAGVPATDSRYVRFDFYEADGTTLISTLRRSYIWVAAGNTSTLMDGEGGITITDMNLQPAFNIYNVIAEENDTTSANLTFNIFGSGQIEKVNIWYAPTSETRPADVTKVVSEGLEGSNATVLIDNLTAGTEYYLWYQAVYKSGLTSSIDQYQGTIKTMNYVTEIDITNSDITTSVGSSAFSLSVSITPDNATDKSYTWSFEDEYFGNSGDSFTPAKAGVQTITVTANGSREEATVSDSITVTTHLAKPTVSAEATAEGILISGYSVADATSYEIHRNDGETYITADESYVDKAVKTSTEYTYTVTAKLTEGEVNLDSAASESTSPISIKDAVINITVPSVEEGFDINIDTGYVPYIKPGEVDSLTFSYEAPEGATVQWLLNGSAINADEGSDGSRITITAASTPFNPQAVQTMTLSITVDGKTYSNSFEFYYLPDFMPLPSFDVTSLSTEEGRLRYSTKTSDGNARTIQLLVETSNDMEYVVYESSNDNVATVDKHTGLVTLNPDYTESSVTITARPAEGNGESKSIVLDIYEATATSASQLVNSVNSILKPAFQAANNEIGDWYTSVFGPRSYTYNFANGSIAFNNQTGAATDISRNASASITSSISADAVAIGTISISGASITLGIKDNGTGGIGGTDSLNIIGTNNPVINVALPYNQGTAHITYNSINLGNQSGTYTVSFDSTVGFEADQSMFNTTVNNSSDMVQLL